MLDSFNIQCVPTLTHYEFTASREYRFQFRPRQTFSFTSIVLRNVVVNVFSPQIKNAQTQAFTSIVLRNVIVNLPTFGPVADNKQSFTLIVLKEVIKDLGITTPRVVINNQSFTSIVLKVVVKDTGTFEYKTTQNFGFTSIVKA